MRRLPLRSPPRVRGKAFSVLRRQFRFRITPAYAGKANPGNARKPNARITPAYAGKSLSLTRPGVHIWDHPRVCGEKKFTFDAGKLIPGSPPRMRGKGRIVAVTVAGFGITPAYAGKRPDCSCHCSRFWDHPRVCGEKPPAGDGLNLILGSPPRMRGKGQAACEVVVEFGITPACAGKSCSSSVSSSQRMSWTIRSRI